VIASISYFGPFIGASLKAPDIRSVTESSASASACFSSGTLGATYSYNGSTYVVSGQSGGPSNGLRFLLYLIDNLGNPNTSNQIGYLDITCNSSPTESFSVAAVVNQVAVFSFTATRSNVSQFLISGAISTPNGQTSLVVTGDIVQTLSQFQIGVSLEDAAHGLTVGMRQERDNSSGNTTVILGAIQIGTEILWSANAYLDADVSGVVDNGYAVVADAFTSRFIACISGTIDVPVVSAASATACNSGGITPSSATATELANIKDGYLAMKEIYDILREMIETGLSALGQV